MRKICLEDYLGNLNLDLRRKCCTASLPGFRQNSSFPKDWFSHPHLPRRAGPCSHPSLSRTGTQAPIPVDQLAAGTTAWNCSNLPMPKPARATAAPSVGSFRSHQMGPSDPILFAPERILHFTTQHWSEGPSVTIQHRIPPIHSCADSFFANAPPCQGSLSHTSARRNSSASFCPSSHLARKEPLGTQIHARMGGTEASSP